jgi:hypothetical protein
VLTEEPSEVARCYVDDLVAVLSLSIEEGEIAQWVSVMSRDGKVTWVEGGGDWSLGLAYLPDPWALRFSGATVSCVVDGTPYAFATFIRGEAVRMVMFPTVGVPVSIEDACAPGAPFVCMVPDGADELGATSTP